MKIAFLTEKYTPDIGGLAISSERLARLLASAGHDVRVFASSLNLSPSETRTHPSSGVRVTRFGAHKRVDDTLVDWFELIVEDHKHDPFDVLHAYFLTQAGFVATYAGKFLGVPSVVSIRGNDIDRAAFDPSRFSHTMYTLENASAVTTNAGELVKKAKAFIDREIFLIPNGIDAEHFKPVEKNEVLAQALGLKALESDVMSSDVGEQTSRFQNQVIGFVGELRGKKGLTTLLSAYAQVNKERPMTLLIVGVIRPGEDSQAFGEFIMLNPNLEIFVTGYIPPGDLPPYYSLMDFFVHPSLRDGMPNAVLEAMACGRAVIATPVGGVLDLVNDGENGILVPVSDQDGLADAIHSLSTNQELRARIGKAARQTILDRFSLQHELDGNLDVYRRLGLIS